MDFYDTIDQVIGLIQQRGRVSYSAVKLQFELDDETLEALKDELLFSHPVVDEAGRGLVWTGETEDIQITTHSQPESQPTIEPDRSDHTSPAHRTTWRLPKGN